MMGFSNIFDLSILLFKFDVYFQHYHQISLIKMENTNSFYEMSDKALLSIIGQFVQEARINQNKTQQQTADAAEINRSTLVQIENGRGGTLNSLIKILRVLQQLHLFKNFEVQQQVSPLLLAKLEQQKRKRIRNNKAEENDTNLSW